MVRGLVFGLLLVISAGSFAENVDEVLKTSNQVSEEQLDQTAEKVIEENQALEAATAAKAETAKTVTGTSAVKKTAAVESKAAPGESEIPVLRDEKTGQKNQESPWAKLFGVAAFVMALSVGAFTFIKKASKAKNPNGNQARIEVLHQHFLGPKKSVALIQVAGEAILIGVTDHNINMIKPVALIDDEAAGEPQDFHGFLEDEFTVEQLTAQKSRTRIV